MGRRFSKFVACQSGSAAVEMALVMPLLLVLMFGSFELGNYFLDNHVVSKAVRDGARYASRRLPLKNSCTTTVVDGSGETEVADTTTETKNVTVYGEVTGGQPRLPGWVPDTVNVNFTCSTTGGPSGIYNGMKNSSGVADGAPIVTVSATVGYHSLFGNIAGISGLSTSSLNITAKSQVPVMGI